MQMESSGQTESLFHADGIFIFSVQISHANKIFFRVKISRADGIFRTDGIPSRAVDIHLALSARIVYNQSKTANPCAGSLRK